MRDIRVQANNKGNARNKNYNKKKHDFVYCSPRMQ